MKIYGPYLRKDDRQHIVIVYDNGSRRIKSYPKYLMEQYLGRELLPTETVDHINNDFTDNRIENLQILSIEENARKEMQREERKAKMISFICPQCGLATTKTLSIVNGNKKKNKAGPFCSRSCAGKYSANIQYNHS